MAMNNSSIIIFSSTQSTKKTAPYETKKSSKQRFFKRKLLWPLAHYFETLALIQCVEKLRV